MMELKISTDSEEHQKALKRDDVQCILSMAELQLKYLFHVLESGEERDFDKVLAGYTSIVSRMKRLPEFKEENRDWQDVLISVKKIYSNFSGTGSRNEFALKCLEILAPFLVYSAFAPETPRAWFGCFCYNYAPESKHIYLHFKNACCPESPFAVPGDRFNELALIVKDIKEKGLFPETVGCDSWINELEIFQSFFPPEYLASFMLSTPDSKGGYGWWGQFIGKDGRFSKNKAEKFEKDMQFQYRRMIAKCSYGSFIKHLNAQNP